jgi:hypothetical protein
MVTEAERCFPFRIKLAVRRGGLAPVERHARLARRKLWRRRVGDDPGWAAGVVNDAVAVYQATLAVASAGVPQRWPRSVTGRSACAKIGRPVPRVVAPLHKTL